MKERVKTGGLSKRDILKELTTLPMLNFSINSFYVKHKNDFSRQNAVLEYNSKDLPLTYDCTLNRTIKLFLAETHQWE